MNALSIPQSKQIRVHLQKYFPFPNSKPYAILLETGQIHSPQALSWLCGGSHVHCSQPGEQQMILLHMWRARSDIASQLHKGNCQICTSAPPWGMMDFCLSSTICIQCCVFFPVLVHSQTALRGITKHSAAPAPRSCTSKAMTQLIISPG